NGVDHGGGSSGVLSPAGPPNASPPGPGKRHIIVTKGPESFDWRNGAFYTEFPQRGNRGPPGAGRVRAGSPGPAPARPKPRAATPALAPGRCAWEKRGVRPWVGVPAAVLSLAVLAPPLRAAGLRSRLEEVRLKAQECETRGQWTEACA